MYKLDKKDSHLLFELDRNSRQSIHELAKRTHLSRDVVSYRMKQLEKKEVIKGYITLIDFTKLGYQGIRVYLKLQNTTREIEEKIIQEFLKEKNIITAYRTDGRYDLAIGFLVKDLREYQRTYEAILQKYRRYIIERHFSVFLDFIQYTRNYLVEKKLRDYTVCSTGSFKAYDYDAKDLELLREIAVDSRITLLELARRLGMTPAGVKYKLRLLEKQKVIVAYKSIIDYHQLGYEYYKVDMEVEDLAIIEGLNQYIIHHPNILYRDVTVGGSDFEFDCEFRSQDDFYKMINEMKLLFPGKIRSYYYYKGLKIYKYAYFPEGMVE